MTPIVHLTDMENLRIFHDHKKNELCLEFFQGDKAALEFYDTLPDGDFMLSMCSDGEAPRRMAVKRAWAAYNVVGLRMIDP